MPQVPAELPPGYPESWPSPLNLSSTRIPSSLCRLLPRQQVLRNWLLVYLGQIEAGRSSSSRKTTTESATVLNFTSPKNTVKGQYLCPAESNTVQNFSPGSTKSRMPVSNSRTKQLELRKCSDSATLRRLVSSLKFGNFRNFPDRSSATNDPLSDD